MTIYKFRYKENGCEFYAADDSVLFERVTSGRGATENECLGEVDPDTYELVKPTPKARKKGKDKEVVKETPQETPAEVNETPAESSEDEPTTVVDESNGDTDTVAAE